jgi:ParB/RepB/Spo0J family partition protein
MTTAFVPIDSIRIEARQRKALDDGKADELRESSLGALKESIKRHGLINPVTITRTHFLIAGERRLTACRELGFSEIFVRYFEDLAPLERKRVELDENIRRASLTWQERAMAVYEYYLLSGGDSEPSYTQERCAEELNLSATNVGRSLAVARVLYEQEELPEGKRDLPVLASTTLNEAYGVLTKRRDRQIETELSQLDDEPSKPAGGVASLPQAMGAEKPPSDLGSREGEGKPPTQPLPPTSFPEGPRNAWLDLQQTDFIQWLSDYQGRKFNFLHCDFPYGLEIGDSAQVRTETGRNDSYHDSEELYWSLCHSLAANIDRVLFPSAHVMFWFSLKYYQPTIDFFRTHTDLVVQDFPLIWHKSDNKGVVPDAQRQPRRVYETCLIMSRNDRKIIRVVSNCYPAPTGDLHTSEKPEPMLRHFFSMFVDELTEMLDPTCGSGGALRAAESLGASRVMGLDISREFLDVAAQQLMNSRRLRIAHEMLKRA